MRVAITIICFFLTFTSFGQLNDADAFFRGNYNKAFIHNHNIKQVSVETQINGSKSLLSHFEFDGNGFLTKQTSFDSSGKSVNEYLFTYNKHGDQVERTNIAYKSNETYVTSFNKIYNGSQLVQETSSELPFVTTYIYNEGGGKVQSIIFLTPDTTTSPRRVSLYSYDAKGKLTDIHETYNGNDRSAAFSAGKTHYNYDSAGNVTEVLREGKANYILSYDAKGLLKSKIVIMPEEFSKLSMIDKYSYSFSK